MWKADRRPLIIARPIDASAVSDAINFARNTKLQVAIKSGGHNISEAFLRDGGMLLDLGDLQSIEVNTTDKTAWVGPALWSHLLSETLAKHNLAFPVAHCATVPMGGYLLGGGVGINGDEWGSIACHSVIEAEVVTSDGIILRVSPTNHADLYWALRGGGTGFFGAVTRFKIKLYDLPSHIYESMYFFPLADIDSAHKFMSSIAAMAPKKTELMILMAHNPMAPPHASPLDSKTCVCRVITFANSEAEAKSLLPFPQNHPLLEKAAFINEMQRSNISEMAKGTVKAADGFGFGRFGVDTVWTNRVSESLLAIRDQFAAAPDAHNHVVVSYKINPQLRDDAAFSIIGDAFIGAYAVWRDESNDQANFDWVASMGEALLPFAEGKYINEVDGFRNPDSIKRCYSPESWKRLGELRATYDPHRVFHDYHGLVEHGLRSA